MSEPHRALYFLQSGDGPEVEVTMEEFVAAERRAGFYNTMGRQDLPATAGFSDGNGTSGHVIYLPEDE